MKSDQFVIIHETAHLSEVLAYKEAHADAQIICLDFWVERELKKKNILCLSLRDFMLSEDTEEEWWILAQDVAREWYRIPAMQFFEYDDIRIAEVLEPIFETYLSRLFYYARIYTALRRAYPNAMFLIPVPIVDDAPTAGALITFERMAVVDAAKLAHLTHTVLGERATPPRRHFFPRTRWKSLLVRAYNTFIRLAPSRGRKIYASEYWSHIGSIIAKMEDTELVLMEVSELKHIPWRQIWKHRVRIQHPADLIGSWERRTAARVARTYAEEWRTAREEVAAYLTRAQRELDWYPVLAACEYIIAYSSRVVADIDALGRILMKERPDVIIQLASVGGRRHHFFLIARIATKLKIPTIELQHAGAVFDSRSVHSRLETSYLAAYGEMEREQYMLNGYASEQIIIVGSPRFDQYRRDTEHFSNLREKIVRSIGLTSTQRIVMITVPEERLSLYALDFSSYDLAVFFLDFQEVRKIMPDVQFIFKFRRKNCTEHHRAYLQELFSGNGIAITEADPYPLLCASDCVLSGNSTIMYETMISGRPLLLYPWKKRDYHLEFYSAVAPYARSGAELANLLKHVFSDKAYAHAVVEKQQRFLERHAFDGHSTERVATLLRNFPQKT